MPSEESEAIMSAGADEDPNVAEMEHKVKKAFHPNKYIFKI